MTLEDPSPTRLTAILGDVLGPAFRTLARSLKTGVVLLDAQGLPLFANDAAADLLGVERSGSSERVPEPLERAIRGALLTCVEEGETRHVEVEVKGRTSRLRLHATPVEGGDCGSLVLLEDSSRIPALEAALTLASRMQTGSVFRSEVHDLKAPLNALALNLELLRKSIEEEAGEAREFQLARTEILQAEIARLGRTLDSFLKRGSSERTTSRTPRRFEVRRLVQEVARLVRPSGEAAGVRVRSSLPSESSYVLADRDRVKQALLNLVLNALEAQPDGGRISLSVCSEGGHVGILVEDHGPGIPEDTARHAFDMSFTTKEGGTGIGLTVARSLVESQGGHLTLESQLGEGTTVEISLPESTESPS
jgi:signal transduction histidine kinase